MIWSALVERSRQALACGALKPIDTVQHMIADVGVDFVVRQVSSLVRKTAVRTEANSNPFLPYETELFVAEISDTHVALLNKFNVIEHHLLIVTRRFVDQETLLDMEDFEALVACLEQMNSLVFYNGGAAAGASQSHKHLQLVPLPLSNQGPLVPMQALFPPQHENGGVLTVPVISFDHAFAWFEPNWLSHANAAAGLLTTYRKLLEVTGLMPKSGARQTGPYNLLVTRQWMLLVPRTQDRHEGISVNALGYAGSLFVRDSAQLEVLRQIGPMALLTAVGRTRARAGSR